MRGLARHEALWKAACLAVWKMQGRKAIKAMVHQRYGEEAASEPPLKSRGVGGLVARTQSARTLTMGHARRQGDAG
jgi:hypothetical protein